MPTSAPGHRMLTVGFKAERRVALPVAGQPAATEEWTT
jgi:hypothetical protein